MHITPVKTYVAVGVALDLGQAVGPGSDDLDLLRAQVGLDVRVDVGHEHARVAELLPQTRLSQRQS